MKALEKDRNRRYETANGFAADVQRYLADEPVLACPPSVGYRLRKFVQRNTKALATASLFVILLVLLGAAAAGYLRDRSTRHAATAGHVEQAIATAEDLSRKGRLPDAILSAQTGRALLEAGGGSNELRQRLGELLNDLDLAGRLEEARLAAVKHVKSEFDDPSMMLAYATAFREFGFDVETGEPGEIADRIRRHSIRRYLTQAMEHWAGNRAVDPNLRSRLMAIVTAVDPDPWRRQVRAAQADLAALTHLAAAPEALAQSPASLCLLGDYLQRQGEAGGAAALLSEAQRKHSDDFWVNHNLGMHLMFCRPARLEESIRFFSVAVGLRPQSPGAREKLAWCLERLGRFDEAIATYQAAIRLKPDYAQAHFELGHVLLFGKKDYEGAIAKFSQVLELFPRDIPSLLGRADSLIRLRRLPAALSDCDRALEVDRKRAEAWLARAESYRALGQREKAIADYSEAIRLKPAYVLALHRRHALYLEMNETEKALQDLSRMIELVPQDSTLREQRAGMYRKLRQWDKVIADYTVLIERAGARGHRPWNHRGWAYAEAGRFREAAADFAKMVDQEPTQPAFWYDHAMACLAAGDRKAYCDVCSRMLKRFIETSDPEIAGRVVYACVAAPDAVADYALLVKLAERACAKNRILYIGLLGTAGTGLVSRPAPGIASPNGRAHPRGHGTGASRRWRTTTSARARRPVTAW